MTNRGSSTAGRKLDTSGLHLAAASETSPSGTWFTIAALTTPDVREVGSQGYDRPTSHQLAEISARTRSTASGTTRSVRWAGNGQALARRAFQPPWPRWHGDGRLARDPVAGIDFRVTNSVVVSRQRFPSTSRLAGADREFRSWIRYEPTTVPLSQPPGGGLRLCRFFPR